LLPAPEM